MDYSTFRKIPAILSGPLVFRSILLIGMPFASLTPLKRQTAWHCDRVEHLAHVWQSAHRTGPVEQPTPRRVILRSHSGSLRTQLSAAVGTWYCSHSFVIAFRQFIFAVFFKRFSHPLNSSKYQWYHPVSAIGFPSREGLC